MRQNKRNREAGKALPQEVPDVYAALEKAGLTCSPAETVVGSTIFVPGVRQSVPENQESFCAYAVKPDGTVIEFPVSTGDLTAAERQIIVDGCPINYYRIH